MKAAAASLIVLAALAPCAMADVFYSNDFESGLIGPEWSSNTYTSNAANFSRFNGRYSPGYTVLSLAYPNITPPINTVGGGGGETQFRVTFDLYAIDSWDGNGTTAIAPSLFGPDRFNVKVNGVNRFSHTISNMPGVTQSFRAADTGPAHLGYGSSYLDSIYRGITVDFSVAPGTPIVIRWEDGGLEGLSYESWGIDNVSVSYTSVPTPGSLALLGLGAALLRRRR